MVELRSSTDILENVFQNFYTFVVKDLAKTAERENICYNIFYSILYDMPLL